MSKCYCQEINGVRIYYGFNDTGNIWISSVPLDRKKKKNTCLFNCLDNEGMLLKILLEKNGYVEYDEVNPIFEKDIEKYKGGSSKFYTDTFTRINALIKKQIAREVTKIQERDGFTICLPGLIECDVEGNIINTRIYKYKASEKIANNHKNEDGDYYKYDFTYKVADLPLIGARRNQQLDSLFHWAIVDVNPSDHVICSLYGSPGSGKSRLALELCIKLEEKGWSTLWFTRNAMAETVRENIENAPENLLIVIDDVQFCSAVFSIVYNYFWNDYSDKGNKSVIVLLTAYKDIGLTGFNGHKSITLEPLEDNDLEIIAKDYYLAIFPTKGTSNSKNLRKDAAEAAAKVVEKTKSLNVQESSPLYLRFLIDAIIDDKDIYDWADDDVMKYIITKEDSKVRDALKQKGIGYCENTVRIIRMLGSMGVERVGYQQLEELYDNIEELKCLKDVNIYSKIKEILINCSMYDESNRTIKGVTPDIVGMYYSREVLLNQKILNDNEFNKIMRFLFNIGKGATVDYIFFLTFHTFKNKDIVSDIGLSRMDALRYVAVSKFNAIRESPLNYKEQKKLILDMFHTAVTKNYTKIEFGVSEFSNDLAKKYSSWDIININKNEYLKDPYSLKYADANVKEYIGETFAHMPFGIGRATWKDGTFYEGQFQYGVIEGIGIFTHPDGRTYECSFKNMLREGEGTYIWCDKAQYVGNWHLGLRHGTGRMQYPNGEVADGEWQNDIFQGRYPEGVDDKKYRVPKSRGPFNKYYDFIFGKRNVIWEDGAQYNGEWHFSQRHGTGRMQYPNGEVADGEWQNDIFQGQYPEGVDDKKYQVPEWKINWYREGEWAYTYIWEDGAQYVGEWHRDMRYGIGKMQYPNGKVADGEWQNDIFQGQYPEGVDDKKYRQDLDVVLTGNTVIPFPPWSIINNYSD